MTVHCLEELTRQVSPGDVVFITGVFLPTPYVGFKAIKAGLITDTYLEAHNIVQLKKKYSDMELTPEISQQIQELTDKSCLDADAASTAKEKEINTV